MIPVFTLVLEQRNFGGSVMMAQLWARYDLGDPRSADRHQGPSTLGEHKTARQYQHRPLINPRHGVSKPNAPTSSGPRSARRSLATDSGCSINYKIKVDCDSAIKTPTPERPMRLSRDTRSSSASKERAGKRSRFDLLTPEIISEDHCLGSAWEVDLTGMGQSMSNSKDALGKGVTLPLPERKWLTISP